MPRGKPMRMLEPRSRTADRGRMFVSIQTIAGVTGCSLRNVCKWIDQGLLKGFRLPGSKERRVYLRDLHDFMVKYGYPLRELYAVVGAPWAVVYFGTDQSFIDAMRKPMDDAGVIFSGSSNLIDCVRDVAIYRPQAVVVDVTRENQRAMSVFTEYCHEENALAIGILRDPFTVKEVQAIQGRENYVTMFASPVDVDEFAIYLAKLMIYPDEVENER